MAVIQNILDLDLRLSEAVQLSQDNSLRWRLMTLLAHSGNSWFWAIGLAILWLAYPAGRAETAFLLFAIVALAAVVMCIKYLVGRRRPPGDWALFYRETDPHSFPSGHAARAWMLAVFAAQAGPLWLAGVTILWALAVSYSRMATRMHYFSDVMAGCLLGLAAGGLFQGLHPWLQHLLPFIFHS